MWNLIRNTPHDSTVCGLLLLTLIAGPRTINAAAESDPPTAAPQASATADRDNITTDEITTDEHTFELFVVGPDGKPIPDATVELRTSPVATAEQITRGKFVRKHTYGTMATTDAKGRLIVKLPSKPSRFNVSIETAGYAPYWAGWSSDSHPEPVPARFTAELDAGWSVGGIIVDDKGQPVEGVKVNPSIKFKKRAGDLQELGVGTNLKTDAAGKWRYNSVPASENQVFVEINHSSFKPHRRPLTRSEFGIERGQEPVGKIALDRGLMVVGKVTDEAGNPIVGALVRTKFLNDIRETKTGNDGTYRLEGCEPRMARIVISAKGMATDMQEVRVDPEMEPVNFQMQPGGTIRIRVLDEQDRPIPKARIFFQRWRGQFDYFEFNHVSQYADEQGVWIWNEAPLDPFEADICRPGGMQLGKQPLIARDEEYVFRPPPALVITGKVIDAETKALVKKFQVVPGVRSSESRKNWVRGEQYMATEGQYRLQHTHDYLAHLVRIEAEGYQPAVSRDIKSHEGQVSIDFELRKGTDLTATVLTPAGGPAVRARVALGVAGSQISIKNGDIDSGQTYCARQEANDSGQFKFPPQETAFQIVITHPAGYAHIAADAESLPATIKLEAWARVEGTFRVGKELASNVPITVNSAGLHSYGNDVPNIFTHYEVTTGKDGTFVFDRMISGRARIGRRILLMVDEGAVEITSSGMMAANFASGKTTRIELGGTGRPIIARLQPPKGHMGKVNWQFALVHVESHLPAPPQPNDPPIPAAIQGDPAKKQLWLLQWQERTVEGKAWKAWMAAVHGHKRLRDASPYFTASVNRDGTFRIDDVPIGDYTLTVRFSRDAAGKLHSHRFSVPSKDGSNTDHSLDLGVLALE